MSLYLNLFTNVYDSPISSVPKSINLGNKSLNPSLFNAG